MNNKVNTQYLNLSGFGRRRIRYQKNGKPFVLVNKKKLKLDKNIIGGGQLNRNNFLSKLEEKTKKINKNGKKLNNFIKSYKNGPITIINQINVEYTLKIENLKDEIKNIIGNGRWIEKDEIEKYKKEAEILKLKHILKCLKNQKLIYNSV